MISDVELIQLIFALGDEAYTGSIARAIRQTTGLSVHVGWLHMRLNRLKARGLRLREKRSGPVNGGRPKSFVRLTPTGQESGECRGEPGLASAPASAICVLTPATPSTVRR